MRQCVLYLFVGVIFSALHCAPTLRPSEESLSTLHARDDRMNTPAGQAESLLSSMQLSVNPCEDFYQYACGGWLSDASVPIGSDQISRGFLQLEERNRFRLWEIIDTMGRSSGRRRDQKLAIDFYQSCMDEDAIESAGKAPLDPLMERVERVHDLTSLLHTTAVLHTLKIPAFFKVGVVPDTQNPSSYIVQLEADNTGRIPLDVYLRPDAPFVAVRSSYIRHIRRMFRLAGIRGLRDADAAFDLEAQLARISPLPRNQNEDTGLYASVSLETLEGLTPHLDWQGYLATTGLSGAHRVNLGTPEFFSQLDGLLSNTPMPVIRNYLRWEVINSTARLLSRDFVTTYSQFEGAYFKALFERDEPWRRCIDATAAAFGDVLVGPFLQATASDQKEVRKIWEEIQSAFVAEIAAADWLEDAAQRWLTEKAGCIALYPFDRQATRDFGTTEISPTDYFRNSMSLRRLSFERQAGRLERSPALEDGVFVPFIPTAYYVAPYNSIAIPVGLLQPPVFHPRFSPAMNFGALGALLGHEAFHAIDRSSRRFDCDGRQRDWPIPDSFTERTKCASDFYGGFEAAPPRYDHSRATHVPIMVEATRTLAENMADLVGVRVAFRAYKNWVADHDTVEVMGDLTPEQLFFVSFAQLWCTKATPEAALYLALIDSHAPPRVRVNASLASFPAFAEAFGCEQGTPMHPDRTCETW